MNRTEQNLKELAGDAKQATEGLMKELGKANENLSSLTVRLDRILMAFAFIGGGNLLLGNDLAGKVQNSRTFKPESTQSVDVKSWNVPYYERLD